MLCQICTHNRKTHCEVGRKQPAPIKCDSYERITREDIQRKTNKVE